MGIAASCHSPGLRLLLMVPGLPLWLFPLEGSPAAAHGTLPSPIAFPALARLGGGPAEDTSTITPVAEAGAEAEGAVAMS